MDCIITSFARWYRGSALLTLFIIIFFSPILLLILKAHVGIYLNAFAHLKSWQTLAKYTKSRTFADCFVWIDLFPPFYWICALVAGYAICVFFSKSAKRKQMCTTLICREKYMRFLKWLVKWFIESIVELVLFCSTPSRRWHFFPLHSLLTAVFWKLNQNRPLNNCFIPKYFGLQPICFPFVVAVGIWPPLFSWYAQCTQRTNPNRMQRIYKCALFNLDRKKTHRVVLRPPFYRCA